MVTLQCLSKILETGSFDIVLNNGLVREDFKPHEEEFDFIKNHYDTYGNVPDVETFLTQFQNFQLVECHETDDFLLSKIHEERGYSNLVPVLNKAAELANVNSEDAIAYLKNAVSGMEAYTTVRGVDIVHGAGAQSRYEEYKKKHDGDLRDFCISTGFHELDGMIQGWDRQEELGVVFARTNQGKSWIMTRFMMSAWRQGFNVGYFSPEMSANKIGYRFDTLFVNMDNTALNWGKEINNYDKYIDSLNDAPATFKVVEPSDFGKSVTVSQIRAFIIHNNIEIMAIDGLTYMTDERKTKSDNKQAELTHISEDLHDLSMELGVPILVVVQANRDGVKQNGGNLELENIRDADGIAYNATKVIAIRQKIDEEILELTVKKNRTGANGGKVTYQWIPNFGEFTYIPDEEDGVDEDDREEKAGAMRDKYDTQTSEIPF